MIFNTNPLICNIYKRFPRHYFMDRFLEVEKVRKVMSFNSWFFHYHDILNWNIQSTYSMAWNCEISENKSIYILAWKIYHVNENHVVISFA